MSSVARRCLECCEVHICPAPISECFCPFADCDSDRVETEHAPVPHLTDRDRLRELYGAMAERPEYTSIEKRIQELLDISDRLARGQEAMKP